MPRRFPSSGRLRSTLCVVVLCATVRPATAQVTLELADYAAAPMTGAYNGENLLAPIARINTFRPEPGPGGRMFLGDLNGPLYVMNAATREFVPYLNLNGRDGKPGIFPRFVYLQGLANGLVSFQFDPDYRNNGRFYTLHSEDPGVEAPAGPVAAGTPGLDLTGYRPAPAVPIPGAFTRECVLVEWTDTNIANATFEGRAREILRIRMNSQVHPVNDMVFNPTARAGDADWRVMYIAAGDGGAGEFPEPERRHSPQRLDTLVGKILRIIPDPDLHAATSTVAGDGRYRIPNDNPFVKVAGARGEVWAHGLRNPHRFTWEVDPVDPSRNRLLALTIGVRAWESVYVVRKGANYGYSEREGNQALQAPENTAIALPANDRIPLRISGTVTRGEVTPTYPVLQYHHAMGFAIAGGFVYHGARLPLLQGKFIFGDLLSGRLWYADYAEMLAADDGKPDTLAKMHDIAVSWKAPDAAAPVVHSTMRPVTLAGFEARRRADPAGAGAKAPTRTDMRFGLDADGEIYIFTKADGMVRAVVGAAVSAP
jgi:hypothetical protein